MYIGEAAKQTGVSIKAIRHYEAIGLLPCARRVGTYRVFSQQDLAFIRLIRQAQQLGFTLAELKQVRQGENAQLTWQPILELINAKESALQHDIERLERQRTALSLYRQEIVSCLENNPDCKVT